MSLSALLASLPPPSLAETDLARFAAQALGRKSRSELPSLARLFGEETLRGYPPSLGPILQALTETILALSIEPGALDSRTVDALLGSTALLTRLEDRVKVQRQRLRPGTTITAQLRQTLGTRLLVLPGVGRELVLVAPVDLAQVVDAHFAVPLGVVLAKPATPPEAEALRTTWAAIEERFGLDGGAARAWTGRFFAISRRENHDAEAAAQGLADLVPERRHGLWELLIDHLRDNELPEQHRSGRRGLERRLSELELSEGGAVPPWLEATLTLADSVYRSTALDPEVMAGRCPVPRADVARWCAWVDVPATMRERVKKLSSEEIAMLLVRLSEEETGRVERSPTVLSEALARALASLRDQCLRPRWQRSRWALAGIDPLSLALARVASGEDSGAICAALDRLAREVAEVEEEPAEVNEDPSPDASTPLETEPAKEDEGRASGRPDRLLDVDEPSPAPSPDGRGVRPSRFHLPPLPPVPPPRPAPRVRPRTDFPPMPKIPPPRPPPTRSSPVITREGAPGPRTEPRLVPARDPSQRAPSQRTASQRSPTVPSGELAAGNVGSPRTVRVRSTVSASHLVTPQQGNEFYDASFRELELIERDLVQRGPHGNAAERVHAIATEAADLHEALGPSARSGDREFQAAQQRIDKVLAYVERIRPLLAPRERSTEGGPADPRPHGKGFWSRIFGKRS